MNAFFSSEFGYCPLVWMFHNRRFNNKINLLQERMLIIVYKDYKSSFAEHLSEDKSFTVHHKNDQKPAIEIHKVKNELCPKIMLDLFKEVAHPYDLRNGLICGSYKIKTVRYGIETIYLPWSKNLVNYFTRNKRICIIGNFPSKNQVMETRQLSLSHLQKLHCKCWLC